MNGPEHYQRAEQLLDDLEANGQHYDPAWFAARMAHAQVHATLAAAAGINPGLQYVVHITDKPSDPRRTVTPAGAKVGPR